MTLTDWRGTPIREGDTVLYGSHIGSHSIGMVEGRVHSFTEKNLVRVAVLRRQEDNGRTYTPVRRPTVRVWPKSLTVVDALPHVCEGPTGISTS